jgi:hypothetical protein
MYSHSIDISNKLMKVATATLTAALFAFAAACMLSLF